MSIKRTIITTLVALTLVAVVAPGVAQGTTIDELLAQIAQLSTQLNALQGTAAPTAPTAGTGNCTGVTFVRNLVIGSTGSDVKCLQTILNLSSTTQVAITGAGSPGSETSYFGSLTLSAVRKYQVQHGWTPANQVGPMTRAALNASLGSVTPVTTLPQGCTSTSGFSSITGASCATGVITLPQGCTSTSGFSPITGQSCATGVINIIPTGAGLAVQLASNNPASGTVILKQGLAPLAKFTFTNGDNAAVKVTSFKVNRTGVSLDSTLSNIYLFNGATRLTDAATVSSGVVTFNDAAGLFTVPSYGSVTITVAADLNATAGQTVGVAINAASSVSTNASSVNGLFPITGNLMTAATATGAGVEFTATTTPTTNTSLTPQNDYTVWQNSAVITTRAVDFTRVAFKMVGSAKTADLQNFRLYVDGVQVGSVIQNLDANNYVTFDLSSSPKRMEAGSRVIKLMADIIGGSSLNFKFRVSVSADANFVDTQYNVNTAPTTATTSGSFTVADVTSGVQTIASGTLTVTKKSDSPSGNIVNTASNASLGKFTLTAAGERVKVESLYVRIIFTNVTGTDDCTAGSTVCTTAASMLLRNGMLLANGVQIGSTTSISPVAAGTLFSPGSSLIVEPGSPVTLEVRGDIYDETGTYNDIDATDTLQISIIAGSSNAQGLVSLSTISAPSATTNGNTLTVATGSVVLSQLPAYTAQIVVAPITAQKLAHFTLTANTTEAVNLTTINVALNAVASSYASNLYVKYGTAAEIAAGKATSVKPTVSSTGTDSWSVNYTLPAGQTISAEVYADISSLATAGTAIATVDVDGTTVSSATSANSLEVAGQNIVFSSGTFAEAFASNPKNQIVATGNSLSDLQVVEAAKYQLTSSYQQYTVTEMRFSVGSDTIAGAIISADLKDGSTILKTVYYDSASDYFNFTGLNIVIPASTTKTLTLAYTLSLASSDAGTSDADVKPTLTYVKRMDPNGTITEDSSLTYAANSTIVYKSIPVLSLNSLPATSLANTSEAEIASVNVKASKGDLSIKQLKFAVAWSDGGTTAVLTMGSLKLFREGTDITDLVTITSEDGSGYDAEAVGGISEGDSTVVIAWDGNTADSITAEDTVTYVLKGTPTNFGSGATDTAGSDAISFTLTRDSAVQTAGHNYLNANDSLGIIGLHDSATTATSAAEEANLIWSDMSAIGHSLGATAGTVGASSTNDWTNSYMVLESLSSQTRTR